MSAAEKQILANRANAQKSTGPKTRRGTPASSNWATTPNQPEEKKESFKNGETNPFCRLPPLCLIHGYTSTYTQFAHLFGV